MELCGLFQNNQKNIIYAGYVYNASCTHSKNAFIGFLTFLNAYDYAMKKCYKVCKHNVVQV